MDAADARRMLVSLSGRTHRVVTGVCLRTATRTLRFADIAEVRFSSAQRNGDRLLRGPPLSRWTRRVPMACRTGSAIRPWNGSNGSFYTVMGLPLHRVYEGLQELGRSFDKA